MNIENIKNRRSKNILNQKALLLQQIQELEQEFTREVDTNFEPTWQLNYWSFYGPATCKLCSGLVPDHEAGFHVLSVAICDNCYIDCGRQKPEHISQLVAKTIGIKI